jgi:hypothetical protein
VTRPPLRTWLAIIGIAVIAAAIVTLLSGSWAPRAGATPAVATRSQPSGAPVSALATRSGTWAYANASHGSRYLAIPEGPGFDVTVCGPLDCLERVSTDAGPALFLQRAGRIGDLSSVMFEEICGPLGPGLCRGSYTILGVADQHPEDPPEHPDDARMRLEDRALPATDAL